MSAIAVGHFCNSPSAAPSVVCRFVLNFATLKWLVLCAMGLVARLLCIHSILPLCIYTELRAPDVPSFLFLLFSLVCESWQVFSYFKIACAFAVLPKKR